MKPRILSSARLSLPVAAAMAALAMAPSVFAQTNGTWDGGGASAIWGGVNNWNPNGTIATGANATATFGTGFASGTNIQVNTNRTIGNINHNSTTTDITISQTNSSVFTLDVTTGSPTVTVGTAARTLTITAPISGNDGLTKAGAGTCVLSGLNLFTGDVTVSAGTLVAGISGSGGNSALGGSLGTKTINVNTGATLRFNVGNVFNNNFASAASGLPALVITEGTLTNGGTATNSALGNLTLAGGTLTSTLGSASGYGSWNLNGTVTSTGSSTISTSAAVPITLSAAAGTSTTFDVQSGTLTASASLGEVTAAGDERVSSLVKTGAGTMLLTGINTYTGATTVNGGTLALSGSGSINTTSGITVDGSDAKFRQGSDTAVSPAVTLTQGTLTGSGTVNSVNVGDGTGGIVSNNDGVAGASLTIGALTFNGAATVNTFSNGTSAPISTTSLASNAAGIVTINPSAAIWAAGSYDLISYGGGSIGGAGFSQFALGTVTGASSRQSKTFGDSGTAITLTVGADDPPYWVGDGDGKWNLASAGNWKLSSDDSSTTFLAGDNVLFNDDATGAGPISVDIDTANVTPTSTTFNNPTKDYVLGSTGGFGISSGSLAKSGSGTLTITNANSYTGNTTISGGVLDVSTDGAQLYSGATAVNAVVTVTNGGVLVVRNYGQASTTGLGSTSLGNLNNSGGQVVLDGGTLRFNNETGERGRKTNIGAGGGTLEVVNNSTLTLNSAGTFIFSGPNTLTLTGDSTSTGTIQGVISGTDVSLVKNGDATWTLSGTNTYTGNTTISAGILAMSGNRIPNSPTIFIGDGATLRSTGTFILSANQNITGTGATGNVLHTTPGTSNFQTTGGSTISTSGTLTISRLDVRGAGNVVSSGVVQAGGTASGQRGLLVGNTVSGDLTLNSGASLTTGASGSNSQDILGNGTATGTFIINGGAYTNTSGLATLQLGNNTGNGGGTLTLNSGSASIGTLVYQVGASQSGIIDLNGGTLTLGAMTSNGVGTREFNFDGGQFVASGGITFPADVTANVKNGGAKIDTNGFSATIASPLVNFGGTSTGGLTKSGLGTLTLSGNNTYAGGTSVTAGTLRFSTVAGSATDVTVDGAAEAGVLVASDDAQWVNTDDLILLDNAAVLVDYGSTAPSTTFAPVSVADFTNGTTPGVRLAGASIPSLQVGSTYPLVMWSGSGPLDGSAFSLLTHRVGGNFSVVSNTLSVTITSNSAGAPISWKTGDGDWDTTSSNWLASDSTATTYFDTLDAVVFGDATGASGNPVVTLATAISPLGMTMDTTGRNYTVSGGGSIGGSGGLTLPVTNAGTLTLSTANNTFSGGTSILGGTLALGHATDTLPDSGVVSLDGVSAVLSLGANNDTVGAVSLKNGASIIGTGTLIGSSYAFESGTVSANLAGAIGLTKTTTGTVTLSGANTYTGNTTVSAGTLVLGNTAALQGTANMSLAIGTTLQLATDTAFTAFPTFGASSGASAISFVSDRATAGAGLTHGLGAPNLGANTFNFTSGANVTSGTAGFAFDGVGLTSGSAGTTILNPTSATVTIIGGVTSQGSNVARTLQLDGTGTGHSIGGVITQSVASDLSLLKSNTSTWTLSGANSYNGTTTIDQGTLVFTTNDQSLTGGLVFGTSPGSVNVGSLDLGSASASFAGLMTVQTNNVSANTIAIGAGETLTNTGSVYVGSSAAAALAKLAITGAGTWAITSPTGRLVVANTDTTGPGASAQLDLSGLATFNADVANVYVGRPTNSSGGAANGRPLTDTLTLGGNNTITASGVLAVGGTTNSFGAQGAFLNLGTQNILNTGSIVVGSSRTAATLAFNTGLTNPSATLRGATGGTSRTDITLGDQTNSKGISNGGGGSSVTLGTMDFTGGTLDARIGILQIGVGASIASNIRGQGNGVFTFDGSGSLVDVDFVIIGQTNNDNSAATSEPSALVSNSSLNVNGGTLQINSGLTIANDVDSTNTTNGVQNVTGSFNQSAGTATIGSIGSPVNVIMGNHFPGGNSGLATATMNLTGGTTNVFGNIQEGFAGNGSIASTLTLDGGTLDLQGNSIGVGTFLVDNLIFQSGTLKNVASINDTGGLVKTTTGTLTLDGTIGYTGATTITEGTLALAATTSIASSSALNLGAAGTLDTSAQATYAVPASQPVTITIDPAGTGSSGKIAAAELSITNAVVTLNPTGTLNDPVYVLATYTSLTGTQFAAPLPTVPAGYTLKYDHEGNKIALVQTSTPFLVWAAAKGLDGSPGKENGQTDDPDKDGKNNLYEFAFDGDPLSGANDGKIVGKVATVGGNDVLTLTLPVRIGATFGADSGDQVSDLTDTIVYRIEGDKSLSPFGDNITEVTGPEAAAIQAGLPGLSDLNSDTFPEWTYRTFRAPDTVTTEPKAFLRAKVTSDAP